MSFDAKRAEDAYRKEHHLPSNYPLRTIQWASGGAIIDTCKFEELIPNERHRVLKRIYKIQKETHNADNNSLYHKK